MKNVYDYRFQRAIIGPPQREKKMREAVIVSYARTGLAKSGRGGFNIPPPMTTAGHPIQHPVPPAGLDKDNSEDCYLRNCAHGAPNTRPPPAPPPPPPKSTPPASVTSFFS